MKLGESLKDTFLRGVSIGLAAGVVKNALAALPKRFGLIEYPFWYYSGVMALNRPPKGILETIFALILELIFCAFLGFIYVVILRLTRTRYKVTLGVFYGSMVWFTVKEGINAFHITHLDRPLPLLQPILIWGFSLIYGLLLGWLDHYLERKTGMVEQH